MNQSTIDTILTAMQQFLSALQLKKSKSVLAETLAAQAAQAETNETGELLAAFLSAKELEGCAERTLRYYESTLDSSSKPLTYRSPR